MKVHELMTPHVLMIHAGATLREAEERMRRAQIGALPVREDGEIVGMITANDLQKRSGALSGWEEELVSDAMSLPIIAVGEGEEADAAASLMREKGIHALLVMDNETRSQVKGIVTARDLARSLPRVFPDLPGENEEEIGLEERRAA